MIVVVCLCQIRWYLGDELFDIVVYLILSFKYVIILKAKYIIHVNGPKFREEDEEGKLRSATKNALRRADEKGVKRLAFPPIGTGLYQVPMDLCARVMVDAVAKHLQNDTTLDEVLFVTMDEREYEPFKKQIEGGA